MPKIKNKETKNLAVFVSGGRSSALTAYHINTHKKYKDFKKVFIFCNTGLEREETFDFLKNIEKFWKIKLILIEGVYSSDKGVGVDYKIVDFDTLDRQGNVFIECIAQVNKNKNIGVPNQAIPYCSDYLKVRPSHKFLKDYFHNEDYIKAIGFRAEDMPKRVTLKELEMNHFKIAPLLTDFITPINQKDLNTFFDTQPFKLEIHSRLTNCSLCYKKSDKNLIEVLQNDKSFVPVYKKLEEHYKNMFFRGNRSIDDFIKLAKTKQTNIFDDVGEGCMCGI